MLRKQRHLRVERVVSWEVFEGAESNHGRTAKARHRTMKQQTEVSVSPLIFGRLRVPRSVFVVCRSLSSVFVVFVGRSLSGQYFGAMKGRFCPEIKDFADTSVRIIAVRIIGRIIGRFEKRKLHAVTYLGGEVGE